MRTTSPPAQIPRISPISSECCDTSSGRLLSLQAAARGKRGGGLSAQLPPGPCQGRALSPASHMAGGGKRKFIESPQLEVTHEDHCVQLLHNIYVMFV